VVLTSSAFVVQLISFGHNSSSSHPAGARVRWRVRASPAGALEFHVRVSNSPHFIRDTAEDCRSPVFALASETVGDRPLLRNGQHYLPSITEATSSAA
jgi:hypothetical protein